MATANRIIEALKYRNQAREMRTMSKPRELLTQIKRTMESMNVQAPDFLKAFQQFKEETEREGALDSKTKKLIAIALAIITKCEWCISMHVHDAINSGATPEEIMEVVFVTTLMGGAPSLMAGQLVMEAVKEFAKPA